MHRSAFPVHRLMTALHISLAELGGTLHSDAPDLPSMKFSMLWTLSKSCLPLEWALIPFAPLC